MKTLEKKVDKNDEIKAVMKNLEKALALCSLNPSPEVFHARSSASLPCSLSSTKSTFTTVSIAPLSITSAADNSSDGNIPQLDGHAEEPQKAEVYEHQGDDDDEWINPHPITGLWICRCCSYAHCSVE